MAMHGPLWFRNVFRVASITLLQRMFFSRFNLSLEERITLWCAFNRFPGPREDDSST